MAGQTVAGKANVRSYQRLMFPLSETDLCVDIERRSGKRVRLKMTTNRSVMARVSKGVDCVVKVRLHRIFLFAPRPVLKALGRFVRFPRSRPAREVLNAFVRGEDDRVLLCGNRVGDEQPQAARARRCRLQARGECFDLAEILDGLNGRHFNGLVKARIGWGRRGRPGPRQTIHFGTFEDDAQGGIIRIHPAVDRSYVPWEFVEYIVFHEMLHAVIPVTRGKNGRRVVHSKSFLEREATFPRYEALRRWEKSNLHRFLRA